MPKRFSKSGAVTCKAQRENVAQPSWLHPVHAMRPDSALPLKRFVGADGVRPSSLVGNIDATNTNTAPTWTNKPGALRPVESQQVVTNSATQYINVSDEISPARRTYNPSTSAAGDTEAIAAKGRLVLVNGSTPALTASLAVNPSELFSQRNMTYNENSIALPSDRGTLEVSGANLMYEGARVKSWMLGRDVNPAGRGDGAYYAQGAFSIGSVRPSPTTTPVGGWGNSVNNGCGGGCGHPNNLQVIPLYPPVDQEFVDYAPAGVHYPPENCTTPSQKYYRDIGEWTFSNKSQQNDEDVALPFVDPDFSLPQYERNCNDEYDKCISEAYWQYYECVEKVIDKFKPDQLTAQDIILQAYENRAFWAKWLAKHFFRSHINKDTLISNIAPALIGIGVGIRFGGLIPGIAAYLVTSVLQWAWKRIFVDPSYSHEQVRNAILGIEGMKHYHYWDAMYDYGYCMLDNFHRNVSNGVLDCACAKHQTIMNCSVTNCRKPVPRSPACNGSSGKSECKYNLRDCSKEFIDQYNSWWSNYCKYGAAFGVPVSDLYSCATHQSHAFLAIISSRNLYLGQDPIEIDGGGYPPNYPEPSFPPGKDWGPPDLSPK